MTVYDLPHCRVEAVGDPVVGYTIYADDGWYLHKLTNNPRNYYKKVIGITTSTDVSTIEVVAEADLPPDANIAGLDNSVTE